jgi:hypothetical protein
MSTLTGDPLTQIAFSVYENKGGFALLLGLVFLAPRPAQPSGLVARWPITASDDRVPPFLNPSAMLKATTQPFHTG